MAMHSDQLEVPLDVVRRLIGEQFPQWRPLKVTPVIGLGTENALFRLGARLVARFPLRMQEASIARERVESEAAAARELLGATRFATPDPLAIGEPGCGYPLPWSVQTWLPGTVASEQDARSADLARDLADFIRGVRALPTRGRNFAGTGRGGDLRDHDGWMQECFKYSRSLLDVPPLRALWAELRTLPRSAPDLMNHGDLIPANVLVDDGRLVGVLDVGGLGPADPALDLVGAWHLLDDQPRRVFRSELRSDELEWQRGKAWAFEQAMGLVWYYADSNPGMSRMGRRTLDRIRAEIA